MGVTPEVALRELLVVPVLNVAARTARRRVGGLAWMDGQGQKQTQGAPQAPGHVPHGHGAWDGVGTSSGPSEPGKLQAKPPELVLTGRPTCEDDPTAHPFTPGKPPLESPSSSHGSFKFRHKLPLANHRPCGPGHDPGDSLLHPALSFKLLARPQQLEARLPRPRFLEPTFYIILHHPPASLERIEGSERLRLESSTNKTIQRVRATHGGL